MNLNVNGDSKSATEILRFFGNSLFMLKASGKISAHTADLATWVLAHPEIRGDMLMNRLTQDEHELEKLMIDLEALRAKNYKSFFARISRYNSQIIRNPKPRKSTSVGSTGKNLRERYLEMLSRMN